MTYPTIPLVIIEEHHEAFLVWNDAIKKKYIPPTNNRLLHIDEHSDMSSGRFRNSIHQLNGNIQDVRHFTYSELTIDTFITTAIYRKIFNRIDWVKPWGNVDTPTSHTTMYVRSYNDEGKKLIVGRKIESIDRDALEKDININHFLFSKISLDEMTPVEHTVLDIDLDYFSCTGHPYKQNELQIEITKEEFTRFVNNPYHRLNYLFAKVEVAEEAGKYYYIINRYNEIYREATYASEEQIVQRIALLASRLKEKRIQPSLIVICRSRHSGFTSPDQYNFIETELMNQLQQLYNLEASLLPQ